MTGRSKPREEDPVDSVLSLLDRIAVEEDDGKARLQLADLTHRASQMSDAQRVALRSGADAPRRVDVAIMTVVKTEREAAQDVFGINPNSYETRAKRRYWELSLPSERAYGGELSLVLMSINDTGNPSATRAAMELLRAYTPAAVFLLGMAAGLKGKVSVGDVVAANGVHYYEPSSLRHDGPIPRPEHKSEPRELYYNVLYYEGAELNERLQEVMARTPRERLPEELARSKRKRMSHKPELHLERSIVASGEMLLEDGEFLKALATERDGRIRAADTEAYGFAVGFDNLVPWGIFRGISDYGELPRPTDWQYLATATAAIALRDFLETEFEPSDPRG